ncbi:DUF4232 domain-containing protein [Streptomyces sp. Vc74B-19]|uniref:DUF4232 domain-containing protein n=1 Tax=Streptomyces sp. Vc74B-19 TaxID=2741324 RepID=UPI001BFC609D|nr:DUF4232 domain-containing protein [Streptomyces sp. Vc74B-19]MBT3166119.1 DUF4232 domain-containing protein [Streptomyces sp. Vc74B-19]
MNTTTRSTRRARHGLRSYAVGAAAVAALLTTTACEGGGGDVAEAPASSNPPAASSPATSAAPGDGDDGDAADSDGTALCTHQDLSFSATRYGAPDEEPRHIMVVATNKGGTPCEVRNAPEIMLGDAQAPAPVMDGTTSDEPVTLAPGGKAYAGLLATGGNRDTYEVTSMTLTLGSPGGEAEAEEPVDLPMPVESSFQADDGQRVTGWQPTEGLAMRPVTRS